MKKDNLPKFTIGSCNLGYYRPISEYNLGKAQEQRERHRYSENDFGIDEDFIVKLQDKKKHEVMNEVSNEVELTDKKIAS